MQQTGSPVRHEALQKLLWKWKTCLLSQIGTPMRAKAKASDREVKTAIAAVEAAKGVLAKARTRTAATLAKEAKEKEREESHRTTAEKARAKVESSPMPLQVTTKVSGKPTCLCVNTVSAVTTNTRTMDI